MPMFSACSGWPSAAAATLPQRRAYGRAWARVPARLVLNDAHTGRQQWMSQVLGLLLPTYEPWLEFRTPGRDLAQPRLSQH